jgi:hypothetical protein
MPRAVGTRSTSARRRIGCALVVALAAIGLAACGDAGRRDAAPAGSATPGAPAVPPKLAIVYTPQPFYQATYLEGILGAGATTGGAVAGAGGFDIPVCRAMYNAYLAGAQVVRPQTTGSFVAIGDWSDVQKAKEAALAQADQGATMFVGCGQGPTFGQIQAAAERHGVASGYSGDMSGLSPSVVSSFTLAAIVQKGLRRDPTVLPAEAVLRMASADGARPPTRCPR